MKYIGKTYVKFNIKNLSTSSLINSESMFLEGERAYDLQQLVDIIKNEAICVICTLEHI